MKAAMVMPALLLQKPHPRSKAKDHLERCLRQWSEGDLEGLVNEGYTIQHQFSRQHQNRFRPVQQTARVFAKLMMEGKVRAALRLIAEDSNGGPLQLDWSQYHPRDGSRNPLEEAPTKAITEAIIHHHTRRSDRRTPSRSIRQDRWATDL